VAGPRGPGSADLRRGRDGGGDGDGDGASAPDAGPDAAPTTPRRELRSWPRARLQAGPPPKTRSLRAPQADRSGRCRLSAPVPVLRQVHRQDRGRMSLLRTGGAVLSKALPDLPQDRRGSGVGRLPIVRRLTGGAPPARAPRLRLAPRPRPAAPPGRPPSLCRPPRPRLPRRLRPSRLPLRLRRPASVPAVERRFPPALASARSADDGRLIRTLRRSLPTMGSDICHCHTNRRS